MNKIMQIITDNFTGQGYSGWQILTTHTTAILELNFHTLFECIFTANMRLLSEDAKYLDERKTGWIFTAEFDA